MYMSLEFLEGADCEVDAFLVERVVSELAEIVDHVLSELSLDELGHLVFIEVPDITYQSQTHPYVVDGGVERGGTTLFNELDDSGHVA